MVSRLPASTALSKKSVCTNIVCRWRGQGPGSTGEGPGGTAEGRQLGTCQSTGSADWQISARVLLSGTNSSIGSAQLQPRTCASAAAACCAARRSSGGTPPRREARTRCAVAVRASDRCLGGAQRQRQAEGEDSRWAGLGYQDISRQTRSWRFALVLRGIKVVCRAKGCVSPGAKGGRLVQAAGHPITRGGATRAAAAVAPGTWANAHQHKRSGGRNSLAQQLT